MLSVFLKMSLSPRYGLISSKVLSLQGKKNDNKKMLDTININELIEKTAGQHQAYIQACSYAHGFFMKGWGTVRIMNSKWGLWVSSIG